MGEAVSVKPLTTESARGLRNIGPPPMVIDELLPVGSITLVSGQPYSGKTFFALEAARAVATGATFMGKWKVSRPGNVLIVEQDSPKYDTGRALWSMLVQGAAEEDPEGPSAVDNIRISWHPGLDLASRLDAMRIIETANRMWTGGVSEYQRAIVDLEGNVTISNEQWEYGYEGASLIILDSSRSLHRGKEDKSDDMEQVMQNIKMIREKTGAAIILIAHDNASGEKTRGSTAIPAAVDTEYSVTKRKRQRDHGVFIRKARAIAPQEFRYKITTSEDENLGTIKRVEFKEYIEEEPEEEVAEEGAREMLMKHISEGSRELQADLAPWAEEHGVAPRTLKKYLAEGLETGYLVVTYRNEGRKRFAIYSVKGGS